MVDLNDRMMIDDSILATYFVFQESNLSQSLTLVSTKIELSFLGMHRIQNTSSIN